MNTTLDFEIIDMLSKAITQFAFRSGPIEEMHSRGKLTQKDMKTLNKYMVNRIAGLLTAISKGEIANILKVLTFYASLSSDWDSCKPDTEEFFCNPPHPNPLPQGEGKRENIPWNFVADTLQYNHERNYLLPNKR